MKPLFSRMDNINIRKRLIIVGLIFFPLEAIGIFANVSIFPGEIGRFEDAAVMLASAVIIAFVDVLIILVFIEFAELFGLLGLVYAISFTHLYTFKDFAYFLQAHYFIFPLTVFGLLGINVLWQFSLLERYHYRRIYGHANADSHAGPKFSYSEGSGQDKDDIIENPEIAEASGKPVHTKEELGRLLNLWQMKYSQAENDGERKQANEKISGYQDELEKLKAKSGTTPIRAISGQGGDKEWKK